MRGRKRSGGNGICPLRNEEEAVILVLIKCKETQRWREQFLFDKSLYINEEMTHKVISRDKIIQFKNWIHLCTN